MPGLWENCCLQKVAYVVSRGWLAEEVKPVDFLMFQEMVLQMGFQSETYCAEKQECLVRGIPSSAGEL